MNPTALQPGEIVIQNAGAAATNGMNSLAVGTRPLLQPGRYWLGISLNLSAQGMHEPLK